MAELLFAHQEWIDRFWGELRTSETLRSEGATWCHGPVGLLVLADDSKGFPSDVLVRLDLHEGEVRDARAAEDAALVPTIFGGTLSRWTQLMGEGGSGTLIDAVRRGHMSFRGDLPSATRHTGMFNALIAAARNVPTTFEANVSAPEPEHAGSAN